MTLAAPPDASQHPSDVDWPRAHAETLEHLQRLIRIDTTNPPGNEIETARYIAGVLEAEGIEHTILEPSPGRGLIVARLRGDGSRRPVLLLAHMDVVGVERDRWSVDPFAAEVKDGFLYGRGAIDDKGMLAANLETMLLLKRSGVALRRDVIFVATADEEAGGEWGITWLAANHPDLVEAEIGLNEGGRTRVVGGRALYMAVQCAEKVSNVVTVTAKGPGGHAAIPLPGNALLRLGRALAAIADHREPLVITPTTRHFFWELSRVWPDRLERQAMSDVASEDPDRRRRGDRVLARVPVFDAVLRAGISATIVQGGMRSNVIPTEATATLNVRTVPGQPLEQVLGRLRRAIGDSLVTLEVTGRGEDAPVSDFTNPLFTALAGTARELDPKLAVVPYLSTGATDSAILRRLGIQCFGILPFPMPPEDEERMHAADERIPLEGLAFGTRLIFGAVRRVAS